MPELVTAALETVIDPETDYLWMCDVSETPDAINRILAKYFRQESLLIHVGDETTDITAAANKVTFRMPFAMTLTDVRASVNTAPTGANIIVDINDGGTSIMTVNKLSIDATEKTSVTATTAAALTDTALADDAEITIDIDQIGSTIPGKGLKVWLIGYRA